MIAIWKISEPFFLGKKNQEIANPKHHCKGEVGSRGCNGIAKNNAGYSKGSNNRERNRACMGREELMHPKAGKSTKNIFCMFFKHLKWV